MADVVHSTDSQDEPGDDHGRGDGKRRFGFGKKRKKEQKKGSFLKELPILIITAIVLTVLIQTFLGRVYLIPSQSMEDTLHGCPGCSNDRVLVDKITYRFSDPKPGDVVVFKGPETWMQNEFTKEPSGNPVGQFFQWIGSLVGIAEPSEKDFTKRVIATGGQTVSCCDRNRVVVDGKPLNEPYLHFESGSSGHQRAFKPVTVPPGRLWVMGDNRNNSADSRVQGGGGTNGTISVNDVIGKVQFIVLPPTRWQSVDDPNPQEMALGAPSWYSDLGAGIGVASVLPMWWIRKNREVRRRDWEVP